MSFSPSQSPWWLSAVNTATRTISTPTWGQVATEAGTALFAVFAGIKRISFTLLILLGSCTLYDHAIGDSSLPRLNEVGSIHALQTLAHSNSTAEVSTISNPHQGWQALSQSRDLLTALSPEISLWLHELQQKNQIEYANTSALSTVYGQSDDTPTLAAYEKISGKLVIHSAFWALSDGEKTAILTHEYRHARQNWPKKISVHLGQFVAGGQLHYQSQLEAEAFDYERQARSALGLSQAQANLSR